MKRFKTLLLREWMQHHRGWLAVMLVPPVLILLALVFTGSGHVVIGGQNVNMRDADKVWLATTFAVTAIVFAVTCLVVAMQAPGIARRDQQDRSIEFWVSLPTPHAESIGAPVLMHALFVPLLGLTLGYVSSQIVAVLAVVLVSGASSLMDVPWSVFLTGGITTFIRLAFGVVLASLWMLPILLLAMAASAWLKRWGVPVLIASLAAGHVVLAKVYDITIIGDTLYSLWANAMTSLIHGVPEGWKQTSGEIVIEKGWPLTTQWLVRDAWGSIADLVQPLFIFALLTSAGCFALLVMRRRRA